VTQADHSIAAVAYVYSWAECKQGSHTASEVSRRDFLRVTQAQNIAFNTP